MVDNRVVFRAFTDHGEILEWYAPQTWRNVFKTFKMHCKLAECVGELYSADHVLLRKSGKGEWDTSKYDKSWLHDRY